MREYGHRTVWIVGLLTRGSPPTWASREAEVLELKNALLPYPPIPST